MAKRYKSHFQSMKIFSLSQLFATQVLFFNNCGGPAFESRTMSSIANDEEDETNLPSDIGTVSSAKIVSDFQYISSSGVASGYAYDANIPAKAIKVLFYIDGPVGVGKYIGETLANLKNIGVNDGHYFTFQIPPAYANGKEFVLYAYGVSAIQKNILKPNFLEYMAFTPKAEAIFSQQIAGFVQTNCTKCHKWDYQSLYWSPLLYPLPSLGGSATTNTLIKKMSGQIKHSGGVFCANNNVNTGICSEIQRWWNAEFK